jgi:curved DNA-binding protein CbpA
VSTDDHYAVLGIDAYAADDEVRRAWRQLALLWHPDRAGPGATVTFQKILAAYTVLSDPVARAAYDRQEGIPARRPMPSDFTRPRTPSVLLRRLSMSLNALLACGIARYAENDVIELHLSAQEASEGGHVTISMRVPVRCPGCAADAAPSCIQCGATRVIDDLFSAWLAVPPGVADGTVLTPSAMLRGMLRPVLFRVRLPA